MMRQPRDELLADHSRRAQDTDIYRLHEDPRCLRSGRPSGRPIITKNKKPATRVLRVGGFVEPRERSCPVELRVKSADRQTASASRPRRAPPPLSRQAL